MSDIDDFSRAYSLYNDEEYRHAMLNEASAHIQRNDMIETVQLDTTFSEQIQRFLHMTDEELCDYIKMKKHRPMIPTNLSETTEPIQPNIMLD